MRCAAAGKVLDDVDVTGGEVPTLPQYPVLDLSDPRDDVPPPGESPADPVAYALS
jgi:hypothetical protein